VRTSGKSPVLNFGRYFLAVMALGIVHVKEKTTTCLFATKSKIFLL
jgi:hypothetical protein